MIVPADDTHDFTPIDPPRIQVGQEVVIQAEAQGVVTLIDEPAPGIWVFGVDDDTFVYWLDTPIGPAWGRVWLYRRQPKPAQGTMFTAGDGSRWVYPALAHGLYHCWQPGTTHGEGLAHKSEIEGLVED